jgi:penicillin V acylase-like amidase (Ntn superfamily)
VKINYNYAMCKDGERVTDIDKAFGAPSPRHSVVTDNTSASIVIEYVRGKLGV